MPTCKLNCAFLELKKKKRDFGVCPCECLQSSLVCGMVNGGGIPRPNMSGMVQKAGRPTGTTGGRRRKSQQVQAWFFLNGSIYGCSRCLGHQTATAPLFPRGLSPVVLQGVARPSGSAWGCMFGPSCAEASASWTKTPLDLPSLQPAYSYCRTIQVLV